MSTHPLFSFSLTGGRLQDALNRMWRIVWLFAVAACFAAPVLASPTDPDQFVQRISTEVLDKVRDDKAIREGDLQRISAFVDATIMPHVNFERMTALAVGRAWRQANPEQQKQLREEFRALLLRTYSGALSQITDQTIRIKPFRGDAAANEVIVRSEIVGKRGDPIQLDYRLERDGTGWKIYDVNVLGIWVVQTYRDQFAQEISAGGLDGLIRSMSQKNKSFASAPRS
jgi:phospholipid transport system substrate-binding protein